MKNKGIPVWEMYFEYIVLAAAGLIFVGLLGWQFVASDTSQKVTGVDDPVTPSNVDQLLIAEAQRIDSYVEPGAPLPFEMQDPEQRSDDFSAAIAAGVAPEQSLRLPDYRLVLVPETDEPQGVPFVEPMVPQPHTVLAAQYYDTLTEAAIAAHTELQDRFPSTPYDISWITTAATFDVDELMRQFRTPQPGQAPIPESWYRSRPNVVDIMVEREEYSDGTWTNLTSLGLLPGAVAQPLRDVLAREITAPMRDGILEQLGNADLQRAVIQPEFFETVAGNWTPPVEEEELLIDVNEDPEQRRLRILKRQLAAKQRDHARTTTLLDEAGGPLRTGEGGSGSQGAGGTGDGGSSRGSGGSAPGGGLGGAQGAGRRSSTESSTGNEAKRRQLTARLDRLTGDIQTLQEEITQLQGFLSADVVTEELGLYEVNQWNVWAHDIEIEPGKTYRYRFTVKVYNPFFARRLNLIEAQHELADEFVIASQTSEWSDPIEVLPPARFFLASAKSADSSGRVGRLGLGQATVDVFRFQNGRWWRERFSVEPGERIGEMKTPRQAGRPLTVEPIDFTTDWFVVDVVENIDASADEQDRGFGATVILQRIDSGEIVEWRMPKSDARSVERERLDGFVEAADLDLEIAASP